MHDNTNLIGAITAHIIFISSILTFLSRIFLGVKPGHWIGIPILLTAFPLAYLLMGPAFRVLDIRMEEAAVVSGALQAGAQKS